MFEVLKYCKKEEALLRASIGTCVSFSHQMLSIKRYVFNMLVPSESNIPSKPFHLLRSSSWAREFTVDPRLIK